MRRLLSQRSIVNTSTLVRSLKRIEQPPNRRIAASLQILPSRFVHESSSPSKDYFGITRRHFATSEFDKKKSQEVNAELKRSSSVAVEATKSRFRQLWEQYGIVFLGFYGGLYLVTLGSVYEVVALKHVDPQSVVAYLHSVGIDKFMDVTPIATSKAGNFALAWILTKFTEPLRLAFTVTITPSLARTLGYAPPKKAKDSVQPMVGSKSEDR